MIVFKDILQYFTYIKTMMPFIVSSDTFPLRRMRMLRDHLSEVGFRLGMQLTSRRDQSGLRFKTM